MDTLKILGKLARLGKVLCRIAFVCCIVGFCLCIAAIASLALGAESLKLGRVTINGLIRMETPVGTITMYAAISTVMILCAGEAVLARFAQHYFQRAGAEAPGHPDNLPAPRHADHRRNRLRRADSHLCKRRFPAPELRRLRAAGRAVHRFVAFVPSRRGAGSSW